MPLMEMVREGGLAGAGKEEDDTSLDILSLGKWPITQKGTEVTPCRGFYIFLHTVTIPNIHTPLYSLQSAPPCYLFNSEAALRCGRYFSNSHIRQLGGYVIRSKYYSWGRLGG